MNTSYKLSEEGQIRVEQTRLMKGWTKTSVVWLDESMISESTLKRFLQGKPVRASSFIGLCNALGISEWQELVEWIGIDKSNNDSTRVDFHFPEGSFEELNSTEAKQTLAVTGVFTEDKRLQVEAALEVLKSLLLSSQVFISKQ
ncbi:hypothetical protein [Nostoc sp.]|uniref:hypothetical protein n=1 Tax=Nostoc sp. TaxID=1180 RepID=UPI003593015F